MLDLSLNDFQQSHIPSNFSQLVSLTDLRIASGFSGEVPTQISHLHKLVSLDFMDSVSFKPNTWEALTKNATHIEDISLTLVDMSSISPSHIFKNISSSLISLSFVSNGLQGNLGDEIFSFLHIQEIDLNGNENLTGYLPKSNWSQIGEISSHSLEFLDVSNNKLSGPIPRSIYSLENLTYLNLSHNFLIGSVQLHHLSLKYMQYVDLSNNSLQGEITSSICNAISLEFLSLSHNYFTGTIPHCIGSSLEILNLSHNKFSGTIPHYVGSSSLALSVMDLQMNQFSGTIPESFEEGNNLRTINFNGNLLGGPFPRSLINCTK
ncbi:receptor-like protein 9DC1 [Prosopis cineraria]|uniref:receptor-like protein 9DC1 n=1 Tax=Prosopis cineraria TaxID=364024 RepID=UPI00240F0A7D|nr:receptor-like protein 9DC1 [Prosopis cineraria]